MNKLKLLAFSTLFTVLTPLTQAQTLLLTLQYQQNSFDVLSARLLTEKLPSRYTFISDADDLSYGSKTNKNQQIQDIVDPTALAYILEDINNNSEFESKRVQGATMILRHPYDRYVQVTEIDPQSNRIFEEAPRETESSYRQKKKKVEGLADQFNLSPGVQDNIEKPVYSDLI